MSNKNMFVFQKFLKAFRDAFRGIKDVLREQSFRTLLFIAFFVFFCLFYFPFQAIERAILVIVIIVVLSLELINSQIERILDILRPDYNEEVRKMKDISAGAVLIASIGALIVGIVLILPYFLEKFFAF